MQIYGWGCSNGWNSIILRGFTASQINCHYKNPSAFAGFSISASSAHNVQNHSNIGDNCVCDKWSSVQRPVSTAGYDTLLLRVPFPLESTVLILLFFSRYVELSRVFPVPVRCALRCGIVSTQQRSVGRGNAQTRTRTMLCNHRQQEQRQQQEVLCVQSAVSHTNYGQNGMWTGRALITKLNRTDH